MDSTTFERMKIKHILEAVDVIEGAACDGELNLTDDDVDAVLIVCETIREAVWVEGMDDE